MENNNEETPDIIIVESPQQPAPEVIVVQQPQKKMPAITTPMAIIIAGALIMSAILITNHQKMAATAATSAGPQTLSEQVGVSKDALTACIKGSIANVDAIGAKITMSVNNAMSGVPQDQRGTPYSVVIGLNGVKTDIRGALPYDQVKKVVDDALVGKVTTPYTGKLDMPTAADHVYGNPNATVTIVEYSDYECPFCKALQPTLKQIVDESNGQVRWIYRHYPIHQHSFEELVAAECVATIKGNDAFWKYSDLLFQAQPQFQQEDSISNQL